VSCFCCSWPNLELSIALQCRPPSGDTGLQNLAMNNEQ
jgi:hypothetical protein